MKQPELTLPQTNSPLDQEFQTQIKSTESSGKYDKAIPAAHFILQGKGGIGKTFIATLIAQYLKQADPDLLCLDTDPVNATFSSFRSLNVHPISILEGNNNINERLFDNMMEQIIKTDSNVVIDNGAASYIPLSTYLIDNEAFIAIKDSGKQVILHSVIAGGLAQDTTVSDFATLTSQLPAGVQVIVWLNEYFGPIEANGKTFQEMKAYLDNKHSVTAIIQLPKRTENTYGSDIATMLKRRLTFDEALQSDDFFVMPKQRIKIVQRSIYEQLAVALQ